MATRRSRLQIKPNILGGPKGPGQKSVPKPSGKDSSKESEAGAETDISKHTKKDSLTNTPNESISKEEAEKVELKTTSVLSDINKDESDGKNLETESKSANANKTDIPALPTRARLRKFGKVNISAARGTKPEPQEVKASEVQPEETKSENLECKLESVTNEGKEETNIEKNNTDDGSKTNSVIQRRSRFPKAKPNLADAGRRRIKEPANKEEASIASVSESPKKIPEILVTEPSIQELKSNKYKPETSESLPSTPTLTQLQPKPPATPISSILKSPLKHPTPTIPVSPEKRARTLSTSEPPIVKRQKKPKVTAPTDQPPDRTTMKMKDLIRWNPSNNPMKPKIKTGTATVAKAAEKENVEEEVDTGEKVVITEVEKEPEPEDDALPVPQVTIGPDGNIVINEKSLIVKGPDLDKESNKINDVIDETDMFTTYGSFRTRHRSKRWTKKETKKFYKALAMIGIDFFLINQLFPNRTRLEIKKKFKKEEKVNKALVDKVLKERINFDPTVFDACDKSSDEDDEDEGTKKKEKKRKAKEQNNTKSSASKRASKRKRARKNYFEDESTTDEDEDLTPIKSSKRNSGPTVSQKDGEVVDILMDMSKGRIQGEGYNSGNLDMSEKLTAVPANKVHKRGSFIPIEARTPKLGSQNNQNVSVENVPVNIPGIQSISIMQPQKIGAGSSVKIPVFNSGSSTSLNTGSINQTINYSNSERSDRRIYIPDLNKTYSSPVQSNIQRSNSEFNQVQYNQIGNAPLAEIGGSSSHILPGTSLTQFNQARSQLQTVTSHNQLQEETSQSQSQQETGFTQLQPGSSQSQLQQLQVLNTMPVSDNSQLSSEDADQYVLVTVMPEGGGETVIHIYRLHGGGQTQNQVVYADQFSEQQMTLESGTSNEPSDGSHDQSSSTIPFSVSDSQKIDTSSVDSTVSNITAEIISDISNAAALQSDVADTSVDSEFELIRESYLQDSNVTTQSEPQLTPDSENVLEIQSYLQDQSTNNTTLNEPGLQNILKVEVEVDTKIEMKDEVSEEIVTHDAQSEPNLTNLNSDEVEIENR